MTIDGYAYDGWPIAQVVKTEPVKLVRSPRMQDISKLFEDKKPKGKK